MILAVVAFTMVATTCMAEAWEYATYQIVFGVPGGPAFVWNEGDIEVVAKPGSPIYRWLGGKSKLNEDTTPVILNAAGRRGWELVCVREETIDEKNGMRYTEFIFKRQAK